MSPTESTRCRTCVQLFTGGKVLWSYHNSKNKRWKNRQLWASSNQHHMSENLSEGSLPPKKERIPGQTCFTTINDKLVQGSVPWAALSWLNAKHILIVFPVWCIYLFRSLVTLGAVETWLLTTVYNFLSLVFQEWAVPQGTPFSITQQNFPNSMQEPFLLSFLLPVRGEGKNCLAMGEKSAGLHSALRWLSELTSWWMQFRVLHGFHPLSRCGCRLYFCRAGVILC